MPHIWVILNLIVSAACLESSGSEKRRIVDQRQDGDVNVHVNLKDLHIFALLNSSPEDYMEYDYAYDYGEMTIKPQNGSTTASPLTNTTQDSYLPLNTNAEKLNASVATAQSTQPTLEKLTTPVPQNSSTSSTTATSVTIFQPNVTLNDTKGKEESPDYTTRNIKDELDQTVTDATLINSSPDPEASDCKKGFRKNKKGECELKVKPNVTNALLKLVELSQKLKLRRENRRSK